MAFRKWIPVLAVIALLSGLAVTASAQVTQPLNCAVNSAVPTTVRAEGLSELVGDVVIACTGGTSTATGTAIPQVTVQVFLNTNITSKITGQTPAGGVGALTEALLLIDEPSPSLAANAGGQVLCNSASAGAVVQGTPCSFNGTNASAVPNSSSATNPYKTGNPNVFQGQLAAANSIAFPNVPIDPPGTAATRFIRITNIRGNANQLGTSSTLVPATIQMFISTTPSSSLPVSNPTQTVAFIQSGFSFAITVPGSSSQPLALSQCTNVNNGLAGDATTTVGSFNIQVQFKENFGSAFKTRTTGTSPTDTGTSAAIPGQSNPNSESGFYNASLWGPSTAAQFATNVNSYAGAGLATQGTRLKVTWTNIPTGVQLFASVAEMTTSSTGVHATLISVTDTTGSTPYAAVAPTSPNPFPGLTPDPVTGTTAVAVYEITAVTSSIDDIRFGFAVAYKSNTAANLPGLGTANVQGSFAPTSTVTTASAVAPVPRFADTSSSNSKPAFIISACVTDLLFPFVTNQAGFDTGIAIANTSTDPFGTGPAAGPCTLYYFGATTGGGAAPATQTTGSVASGAVLVFSLSSGGTGVAATPGFQGYMIAVCNFQYAHAFAFISDLGAQKLAEGYLALVLDNGGLVRTKNSSENLTF